MLQFSENEMQDLRKNLSQGLLTQLKNDNHTVLAHDILVPPDARATWNLYYFCPEHGVRLTWDRFKPNAHCCPIDGHEFSGEPYDGAWWRWLNTLNSKACYELGLLWQLTQEEVYLNKVRSLLLEYAKYYPSYEEHGGIPYNGPGKANAQTLCEANCHLDFARGYDFIRQALSDADKAYIEQRLLREGADFLIQHRSAQLHNHEMKINATVGVIGLLLNEQSYLDFALYSDYGLHYQLNHGCIGEGMWFEGSVHYHYYALQALLAYEKIAYKTMHSVSNNKNLLKMLKFPLRLMTNTGDFPRLNDCIAGQEKLNHSHIFEFAYKQYQDESFLAALHAIYKDKPRMNLEAFLYGIETLPAYQPLACQSLHAPESGYTLGYNPSKEHLFLLKHAPYGGEHDHYDRLGIILIRNGFEILPDLGTTGYGADLHYKYYKNTATHNTLSVNQANQPPNNPSLLAYHEDEDLLYIDTKADWSQRPPKVDSHTITQWDVSAYKNVKFRRILIWLGDALIEINRIHNPHQQALSLTYHVRGKHRLNESWISTENRLNGPLSIMHSCAHRHLQTQLNLSYQINGQPDFYQSLATSHACDLLAGYAPDNPATQDLAYLLVRSQAPLFSTMLVHDLNSHPKYQISNVVWHLDTLNFQLNFDGQSQQFSYNFGQHALQRQEYAPI